MILPGSFSKHFAFLMFLLQGQLFAQSFPGAVIAESPAPLTRSYAYALKIKEGQNLVSVEPTGRNVLNLAVSRSGKKWTPLTTIENESVQDGYAYPSMVQSKDGKVHIIYTFNRRSIKYVVVDPSKMKAPRKNVAEKTPDNKSTTSKKSASQIQIVPDDSVSHSKVYYQSGRFAGWPANNPFHNWGNEIVMGFSEGSYRNLGTRHNIDRDSVERHLLARSLDGGSTWKIEDPGAKGIYVVNPEFGKIRKDVSVQKAKELKAPINFKHAGFILAARLGANRRSEFWYSNNQGLDWKGPFLLPAIGTKSTVSRSEYIVEDSLTCTLFLMANGEGGGGVWAIRTTDGGMSWNTLSRIGAQRVGLHSTMPSAVRLSQKELLVCTRDKMGEDCFISSYYSSDNGLSWESLGKVTEDTGLGNPPALIKLKDGRVCMIFGYRVDPGNGESSQIRAKLSDDQGRSWGAEYILRANGATRDMGYPQAVQRPDGKIVVVYYFNDTETGPERYIACSIWSPPAK